MILVDTSVWIDFFTVRKTNDCLIAAIAIESDYVLLHKGKDFTTIAECTILKLYQVG